MTSPSGEQRGFLSALFNQALHTYFSMRRGLTLGVRAIVRSDDGEFLLVRHTYTPGWHFPGGGVEKGESALAALYKELRQETGLKLIGKASLHGVFHNIAVSKRDHVMVFVCDVTGSIPKKPNNPEIAEIGYFAFDDLPEGIDPGTLRRIREIVDGLLPSENW